MPLHEQLLQDLTAAMKSQDRQRVDVLRLLKAALLDSAKAQGNKEQLSDTEVVSVLQKEAKKRKESIQAFTDADRTDLVDKEQQELDLIQQYLPEQMSEQDLLPIVQQAVADAPEKNFGAVMPAVMKQVQGQADGNMVKQLVEQELNK